MNRLIMRTRAVAVLAVAVSLAAATLPAAAELLATAALPQSPVADAAMRRDIAAVRTLLKQRADVNAPQGDGMTALHWAAKHGDVELTKVLLRAKANVGAVTRIGAYAPL